MPEARCADRVVRLSGYGLVDRLTNERDGTRRIVLARILTPGGPVFLDVGSEDLRADGRGPDVDREDPRHAGTIASGSRLLGRLRDRQQDRDRGTESHLAGDADRAAVGLDDR